MNTITIPIKKPRNPMVVPSTKRKAGKHRDRKKEEKRNPSKKYENDY